MIQSWHCSNWALSDALDLKEMAPGEGATHVHELARAILFGVLLQIPWILK